MQSLGRSSDKQQGGCEERDVCMPVCLWSEPCKSQTRSHEQDGKQDQTSLGRYKSRPKRKLETQGKWEEQHLYSTFPVSFRQLLQLVSPLSFFFPVASPLLSEHVI